MRCIAVVELSSEPAAPSSSNTAGLSSRLLEAAYQASRRGFVALLLPEGMDRTIDRALDPLVAANRHVHGVIYRGISDASVWEGVDRDALCVVSSPRPRAAADEVGARCVEPDVGLLLLQHLGLDGASTAGQRLGAGERQRRLDSPHLGERAHSATNAPPPPGF
jgi:hypothetical protein